MGPAVLAWKIANYPKIWIPFLCILVGVIVLIYFLVTGTVGKDPMPAIGDVKEMYICWGNPADEDSFKKIPHGQYYPQLFESTRQGFASRKETGPAFATVRVVTNGGSTTTITFHEEDLIKIDGQVYDRTMAHMFIQQAEGTRYDMGY
jgi:hypothetical protein